MIDAPQMRQDLEHQGCVWRRHAVPPDELARMGAQMALNDRPGARIHRDDPPFETIRTAQWAQKIAGIWPSRQPVRVLSFDKSPDAIGVPWHQDRVIAVKEKADAPGVSNWSKKPGIWHCEPPADILDQMLFVRVHFDRTDAENGAMEIARASHKAG